MRAKNASRSRVCPPRSQHDKLRRDTTREHEDGTEIANGSPAESAANSTTASTNAAVRTRNCRSPAHLDCSEDIRRYSGGPD